MTRFASLFRLGVLLSAAVNLNAAAQTLPPCLKAVPLIHTLSLRTAAVISHPLDFDGDGVADTASSRKQAGKTVFDYLSSKTSALVSAVLPKGGAVPGDYDGDGKWDAATVSESGGTLSWSILLSSTGEVQTKHFGKSGDTILFGCRFLSSDKYSLAVLNKTKIQAIEIGSGLKKTINFSRISGGKVIGCGDATGDGIDELLVESPSPSGDSFDVSAVSCSNNEVNYGQRPSGVSTFVFDAGEGKIPVLGVRRLKGNTLVRLSPLYDTLRYPHFYLPTAALLSFASFSVDGAGVPVLSIQYQVGIKPEVYRALFSKSKTVSVAARLQRGAKLLASQGFVTE